MLVEFMGLTVLGSFPFTVGLKNYLLVFEDQLHHQAEETSFENCWGEGLKRKRIFLLSACFGL